MPVSPDDGAHGPASRADGWSARASADVLARRDVITPRERPVTAPDGASRANRVLKFAPSPQRHDVKRPIKAQVLASEEAVQQYGLTPLARIVAAADAAQAPEWFTTAPAKAIPKALDKAGWTSADVDLWELNEAFAVVGLANNQLLGLYPEKVNVNGGAVSLGHPLGSSGSRIVVTLVHALKQRGLKRGAAGICNGGGGASAICVELV